MWADNIINVVSCDGLLTTPLGRELFENSIITPSCLKTASSCRSYIFMYIKEIFDSEVYAKNIEIAVNTLKEALELSKIKSFSVSRFGNGFDELSWSMILIIEYTCIPYCFG